MTHEITIDRSDPDYVTASVGGWGTTVIPHPIADAIEALTASEAALRIEVDTRNEDVVVLTIENTALRAEVERLGNNNKDAAIEISRLDDELSDAGELLLKLGSKRHAVYQDPPADSTFPPGVHAAPDGTLLAYSIPDGWEWRKSRASSLWCPLAKWSNLEWVEVRPPATPEPPADTVTLTVSRDLAVLVERGRIRTDVFISEPDSAAARAALAAEGAGRGVVE